MLIKSFAERQSRTAEKRDKLLRFLRDETWSSLANLSDLLGMSISPTFKTLQQLTRDDFLVEHKIPELRLGLWGITPKGLAFAWDESEAMAFRPYFEPGKLSVTSIRHNLDIQRARLIAERAGWTGWIPGTRLPPGLKKRPDAVASNTAGEKIAVEVERSVKTQKRYESIFSIYLQLIRQGHYQSVHYVCPDAALAPRLQRLFGLVQAVPVAGDRVPISERHRARFPVFALDNWPPISN